MIPTLNTKGDAVCAFCNRTHRERGWFCSRACDDAEMATRVGWLRLVTFIVAAGAAALRRDRELRLTPVSEV